MKKANKIIAPTINRSRSCWFMPHPFYQNLYLRFACLPLYPESSTVSPRSSLSLLIMDATSRLSFSSLAVALLLKTDNLFAPSLLLGSSSIALIFSSSCCFVTDRILNYGWIEAAMARAAASPFDLDL